MNLKQEQVKVKQKRSARPHKPRPRSRQRASLRAGLAGVAGRFAGALGRRLHLDGRTGIVGLVTRRFRPGIARQLASQLEHRNILITGLYGKTTSNNFNEMLRTLFPGETERHVLFVLNDHSSDGRDISWIWDVDFERLIGQTATLVVAGTRALDLALRLKYAGIEQGAMIIIPPVPLRALKRETSIRNTQEKKKRRIETLERVEGAGPAVSQRYGITAALDEAVGRTPAGETLFVVATYTGLLAVHEELERRKLAPRKRKR